MKNCKPDHIATYSSGQWGTDVYVEALRNAVRHAAELVASGEANGHREAYTLQEMRQIWRADDDTATDAYLELVVRQCNRLLGSAQ